MPAGQAFVSVVALDDRRQLMSPCLALRIMAVCASAACAESYAQAYPNKPVLIVTSNAGSNADSAARLIARSIAAPLGQPVNVDNHGGLISGQVVARAM